METEKGAGAKTTQMGTTSPRTWRWKGSTEARSLAPARALSQQGGPLHSNPLSLCGCMNPGSTCPEAHRGAHPLGREKIKTKMFHCTCSQTEPGSPECGTFLAPFRASWPVSSKPCFCPVKRASCVKVRAFPRAKPALAGENTAHMLPELADIHCRRSWGQQDGLLLILAASNTPGLGMGSGRQGRD